MGNRIRGAGYKVGGRERLTPYRVGVRKIEYLCHETDVELALANKKPRQDGYKLTAEKTYREYGINGLLLYAIRLNRQFGYTEENVLSWVEGIISAKDREKLVSLNLQKRSETQQGEHGDAR